MRERWQAPGASARDFGASRQRSALRTVRGCSPPGTRAAAITAYATSVLLRLITGKME